MELRWPGTVWPQTIDNFEEGARNVLLPGAA